MRALVSLPLILASTAALAHGSHASVPADLHGAMHPFGLDSMTAIAAVAAIVLAIAVFAAGRALRQTRDARSDRRP